MPGVVEHGFEILQDIFDPAHLTAVLRAMEGPAIHRSRAGARNIFQLDGVRTLAHDDRLMHLARSCLGESAFPFRATLFDKSPQQNWLVVWHQDTALPLCRRSDVAGWGPWSIKEGIVCAHAPAHALEQVLAIRVHLDDSNEENGPLRVLPGTHRRGVLSDEAIHDISNQVPSFSCCVHAGGVVAMRPLLVHASSKAQASASPRRVIHIEYAARADFLDGVTLRIC